VSGTQLVRRHGYRIFQEGGHPVPFPSLLSSSHVPFSIPFLFSVSWPSLPFSTLLPTKPSQGGRPMGNAHRAWTGSGCRMHLHCQPQNHYLWTQNGNNFAVLKISIQNDTHLKSYNIVPMSVEFWHRLTLLDVIKGLANRETVIIMFLENTAPAYMYLVACSLVRLASG